jgi:hypothetical protein
MSTRAVIACSTGDGRWRGVWNHWSSHTQYLGTALIERVRTLDGDIAALCKRWIDRCPEGWSNFAEGERTDEGGIWSGTFRDGRVTFEKGEWPGRVTRQLPDAHYLYVFDLPKRTLLVFEVQEGESEPFTQCLFDRDGNASPATLAPVGE